jgi:hypothetical protein
MADLDDSIFQRLKAEVLRRTEQEFDRDMEQMRRIAAKYGLSVDGLVRPVDGLVKHARDDRDEQKIPTSAAIISGATDFLRRRGTRAQSGEIAKTLVGQGLNLGESAGRTVSSYMTRAKKIFDNKPEFGGYGLAEWNGARAAPTNEIGEAPGTPPR